MSYNSRSGQPMAGGGQPRGAGAQRGARSTTNVSLRSPEPEVSATAAASASAAYPAEWEYQISNLAARFEDNTRDEIISALHEAVGHGGHAASILMGRPVLPRSTGDGRAGAGAAWPLHATADSDPGVSPDGIGRRADGKTLLLRILITSRVLRARLPDVRRRALAETVRAAATAEAATDILLENVASSPYLPQARKDPLAELAMTQQFEALATELQCDERLACLAPTTPEEDFRALRQMVVAVFTRSRRMQRLPAAKRRHLGAAIHAQQTADDIKMLALSALETSQAFDGAARDLVANDIFDGRYDRLLLPDRFDCDEESRRGAERPIYILNTGGGAGGGRGAAGGGRGAGGGGRGGGGVGGGAATQEPSTPLPAYDATEAASLTEEGQECPVCLGVSPVGAQLPCGHQFCQECIETWAQRCPPRQERAGCPLCRAPFTVADISTTLVGRNQD